MYTSTLKKILDASSDPHSIHTRKIDFKQKSSWYLDLDMLVNESIVRNFTWAQWDPIVQAIYYIHLKPSTTRSLLEKDEKDNGLSPTLSAYQFNDDLPTETVVSCCKCETHRRNQIFTFPFSIAQHSAKPSETSNINYKCILRRRYSSTAHTRLFTQFNNRN